MSYRCTISHNDTYQVWRTAILRPADFMLAICAFGLLVVWRWPPWIVVLLTGLAGGLVAALS